MKLRIHRSILLTIGTLVIFTGCAFAEEEAWNVLIDSTFDKGAELPGWTADKAEGETAVVNGALEIKTRSGKGMEWADNYMTYKNGFGLTDATVNI